MCPASCCQEPSLSGVFHRQVPFRYDCRCFENLLGSSLFSPLSPSISLSPSLATPHTLTHALPDHFQQLPAPQVGVSACVVVVHVWSSELCESWRECWLCWERHGGGQGRNRICVLSEFWVGEWNFYFITRHLLRPHLHSLLWPWLRLSGREVV